MKMIKIAAISLFVLLMFASAYPNLAQSTDADFELAVIEYQRSYTIAAAGSHQTGEGDGPIYHAIPEEARRHCVRGAALFKDAASPGQLQAGP